MQPVCEQMPLGVARENATYRSRISPKRAFSPAFTLAELLVVIGIISVLISILLPVLRKVREQANAVVCASNQRQVLHSMLLYAQDNDGWMPVPIDVADPVTAVWYYKKYPYAAIQTPGFGLYSYTLGAIWPYVSRDVQIRQRIFSCPSDGPDRYAGWGPRPFLTLNYPRNFSFNFNGDLVQGFKLTQIRRPASKIILLEMENPAGSAGGVSTVGPADATGHSIYMLLTTRHSGFANEGFADQHVERIDPYVFDNPLATGGRGRIGTDTYVHYITLKADQ